jgi:hypothetical protein
MGESIITLGTSLKPLIQKIFDGAAQDVQRGIEIPEVKKTLKKIVGFVPMMDVSA